MRVYIHILFFFTGLVLSIGKTLAQESISFQYSQQNGLPQNSVNDLWFDNNEYLWLTTEAGLVRFDGSHFHTFQSSSYPAISNDRFRWIHQTSPKQLITGNTDGQLWRIDHNTIKLIHNQPRHNFISLLNGAPSLSNLLQLSNAPVSFIRNESIRTHPSRFIEINQKDYFVLGQKYIYRYRELNKTDSLGFNNYKPISTMFKVGNNIYIKSSCNQILHADVKNKKLTACKISGINSTDTLLIFWKDGYKYPLVVAHNKLYILKMGTDDFTFETIQLLHSIPISTNQITQVIHNDETSTIAIATKTSGFFICKPNLFKTLTAPGQIGAYGQVAVSDSSILNGLGYELSFNHTSKSKYAIRTFENVLLRDQYKRIWYSRSDSLYIFANGKSTFALRDYDSRIKAMYEKGDTVIVSSRYAIHLFIKAKYVSSYSLKTTPDEPDNMSPSYYAFFKNRIYFGNPTGVFSFNIRNNRISNVQTIATIPNVRYLFPYKNILLGCSYGSGVFALINDSVISLPLDHNMYLSKAHSIRVDSRNRVFISTNNGLFYTSWTALYNYITHKQSDLYYQYLNNNEGITNVEFNGGCTESSVSLKNGYFSFSNMGGYVWFNPSFLQDNFPNNPIYIDDITIDDIPQEGTDSIFIKAGAERVNIAISSAYWGNPYNIKMEYKIEGYNKDWLPISNNNPEISFINLPSGNYPLVIRRKNGFGKFDYTISTIRLFKEKRYYQTIWFAYLSIITLGGSILGLNYLYNKRLRVQNILLEKRVSDRTKELQRSNSSLLKSEQDLMQSVNVKNKLISIISHDIVTPLKFISLVSRNFKTTDETNTSPEKEVIREIHHTSQRLHENAQNILNWVRYQNNLIKVNPTNIAPYSIVEEISDLLLEIATSRKNTIINNVDMDDVIKADKTIITIILQNILSNAVKYTHTSTILITSLHKENNYIITVSDDGPGIGKHTLQRIENIRTKTKTNLLGDSAEGTGLGYIIIFELAELIGASINVNSSAQQGTTIEVVL